MRAADRSAPPILGLLLLIVIKYLSLPLARALSLSAFVAAAVPAAGLIWQSGDSAGEVSDIFVVKKILFKKITAVPAAELIGRVAIAQERSQNSCVCVCVCQTKGEKSRSGPCVQENAKM